jgi:excinuclease UvrABC nuclease subunit
MLKQIREALEEYKEKYRKPGLPDLVLSEPYDLTPDVKDAQFACKSQWNDTWPNSTRRGVYFILSATGRLLYVGKASMDNVIGDRLSDYFETDATTKRCRIVHDAWSEAPRFVATVAVPVEMGFEAPALEEFLIEGLAPTDNVRGRNRKPQVP